MPADMKHGNFLAAGYVDKVCLILSLSEISFDELCPGSYFTTHDCLLSLFQLPGTELLAGYAFKFGKTQLIEMPPAINPTGCARSEPKLRTHFRK